MNISARKIITALALLALTPVGAIQAQPAAPSSVAGDEEQQPIRVLYNSYDKAQFAVQMPLTAEAIEELRPRLGRYWYLLLHASQADLNRSGSPVIQFGFFASREEAAQFAAEMQELLGRLQVVDISRDDYKRVLGLRPEHLNQGSAQTFWLSPADDTTQASLKVLLDQAKAHYIDGNYKQALNHYLALSLAPDAATSEWARELVGLSFERLEQRDQAKAVYQRLLADAPASLGAPRVTQRLRALETAMDDGQEALRRSRYQNQGDRTSVRGVFGQSYRYLTRSGDQLARQDVLSVISTNFDVHAATRTEDHEFEARLNGYVLYDEMNDGATRNLLRNMNIKYTHTDSGLNLTGGRLRDFRTGVYSSFDGVSVQYPVMNKLSVGFNYGEPVLFADVYDDLDRSFFSLQANYEFSDQWRLASYYTEQTLFGEDDRKAYGGEVRYRGEQLSAYINLDYDYIFADFNNLLLGSTYRFDDGSHLTGSYGRQRSPFLTATNILVGQSQLDIEDYLRLQINRDNLLYDALQRTAVTEFGSLSYSRKLEENLDLSVDVYQSAMNEVPLFLSEEERAGEPSVSAAGSYRYSSLGVHLNATNFLGMNDTATVALRYSDTSSSSTSSLQLGERLRFFSGRLLVTPKLNFAYTQRKDTDYSQLRVRSSIAVNYRPVRNADLHIEVGNESFNDLQNDLGINSQFLYAGYSWRF